MRLIINLLFIFSLFAVSCKKNQAGGNAEIRGKVVHHTTPIPGAMIYVKYSAKEFPGTTLSAYDTQLQANASGEYSFKCYPGEYFLYARGVDNAGDTVDVDGGVPVSIRAREVVEATIAVSEVH